MKVDAIIDLAIQVAEGLTQAYQKTNEFANNSIILTKGRRIMRCKIFLFTLSFMAGLVLGCDSPPTSVNEIANPLLKKDAGSTVFVSPSGDASGVIDANNIEEALNEVKVFGGTVCLTDGEYYTSRNIVVENFRGTLKGESMDNTIIHAGRKSPADGDGFVPAFNPWWASHGSAIPELATVLQFDDASGSITITDLTVEAKDDQPTDLTIDYYGNPATYITTLIEIIGGEHDTRIENVRVEGKETGAEGNLYGRNVDAAIHVMSVGYSGTKDLHVKNIEIANTIHGFMFMDYQDGSTVSIDGVRASNVHRGIFGARVHSPSAVISNSDIVLSPNGWAGIDLRNTSGMEVTGNTVTGSAAWGALWMRRLSNSTIVGNTIEDVEFRNWWSTSIYLWNSHDNRVSGNDFEDVSGGAAGIRINVESSGNTLDHNNFVKSGLPGWTATTPAGPGAILLYATTTGNAVFEMMLPPSEGIARCQMIWDMTDDPETTEYDGANEIHAWWPCENLAERVAGEAEPDPEPGFHRWH
jgi:parallel beta-helix repeat protein